MEVPGFGHTALLLTTCSGAACGLASGSSTFLSLVSEHDVSKPQVSLLSEKDITSKFLLQDLLISFPHLSLLSYSKDKSPLIIKSLSYLLAQQPHKAESSAEPEYSSSLHMSRLHGN